MELQGTRCARQQYDIAQYQSQRICLPFVIEEPEGGLDKRTEKCLANIITELRFEDCCRNHKTVTNQ